MIGSGLKKFGAVFGDRVQTGCNTVTSPGTVVGQDSIIMPNTTVRLRISSSQKRVTLTCRSVFACSSAPLTYRL